uniref:Uncharacterized protein n=1 Tax=Arundo donax TaxID=35708 RepID=A0A0A9CVM2_ARUDO
MLEYILCFWGCLRENQILLTQSFLSNSLPQDASTQRINISSLSGHSTCRMSCGWTGKKCM